MPTLRVSLQWTVVVFNTVTLIVGVLAVLATIYELQEFSEGSTDHIEEYVQLGSAGMLIICAFIGCAGAFVGSIKVLLVYIALMVMIIISHIWKLANYNETKPLQSAEAYVMDTWMTELSTPGVMGSLQQKYECCGDKHYTDYSSMGVKVPESCYHTKDGLRALNPYGEGCMAATKRAYMEMYQNEGIADSGLIVYEILGIVLAITLACQLTNKTRRYAY